MKWIGQHIWSLISRFRSDVYLEGLSTTTETNVLAVDTNGKIGKNSSIGKHIIHYSFRGYSAGLSSGNFQFSEDYADAQAPFQLNQDYGATAIASGNLPDVSNWFRSSITVMPKAVTATRMYGWVTCGGTNNVTIALCKITPTRNSNAAVVPIVVATTVIAAIDNDKMDFFDITTSDAGTGTGSIVTSAIAQGDILMPFIIVPNTKTAFFNLTLEVEG